MPGKKVFGKRRNQTRKNGEAKSSWVGIPKCKRVDYAVKAVQEGWRSIAKAADYFEVPEGRVQR